MVLPGGVQILAFLGIVAQQGQCPYKCLAVSEHVEHGVAVFIQLEPVVDLHPPGQPLKEDMDGRIDVIIDGGPCQFGVESTVLSLMGTPTILRPGGITREMLEAVIGPVELASSILSPLKEGETAASPGMKYRHYAPDAEVIVATGNVKEAASKIIELYDDKEAEGLRCTVFATEQTARFYRGKRCVIIGERSDPATMCANLFAMLREQKDTDVIFCEALPEQDMGLAYMNRLLRSAGFKTI